MWQAALNWDSKLNSDAGTWRKQREVEVEVEAEAETEGGSSEQS
jgi:hypothetical protein